ncbi:MULTISPECIES: LysR family transcriptional regulator [unclassified Crossiella]|uniref:LysR family transcriptional regulator n=1 Tax=unclassified Crossiella TaxID=2620835 RepID=UPI001FFF364B|nr:MULTISPECIES: LysR family transcriptional regulator [unclassified Crossiella]MCK2243928.1 LysR family transcriptional regulator [Crossiella sp. S99.2]MCK2257214.1 LysR family transcriptional regulator [Crossiella sp. S99.1]
MLDIGRLRALHAVAVHGSVNAAAAALGYTPSAVSQQLAKLERETGTTLLERRGRGIALTDAATELAGTAKEILALVEQAEVRLEEQRGLPVGQLTLATFATAARGLLPGPLAELAREYPELDVRLTELDPHLSMDLVARGELDLAVVHDWENTPLAVPEGLARADIGVDVADVLLHESHPLAARAELSPLELTGARWICQPPGSICHDWLIRTLRGGGVEPVLAHQVTEYQSQLALAAQGLGVCLLPRLGRGPVPAHVVVRPLVPTPTRRLFAVWRQQATRRPAISVTVAALRAHWADRDTASAPMG